MKQLPYIILLFVPVGLFSLWLLQMIVANEMIVRGMQLSRIERRINELTEQNQELSRYVAQAASIRRIELEARNDGFSEPKDYIAFDEHAYSVAFKR